MLLSGLNSFTPSTTILSAAVNANFTAITAWANGNISNDNIGTLDGALSWTISGNHLALSIGSASTAGVYLASLTGVLASTKSAFDLQSAAAQTAGRALAYFALSNPSSSIPVLSVSNPGSGAGLNVAQSGSGAGVSITDSGTGTSAFDVNSTTKGARPFPRMTTTQRDALVSPAEGLTIYNLTAHAHEFYNGTEWISVANSYGVDDTTIEVSGGDLRVKDDAISTNKIQDDAVTTDKIDDDAVTSDKIDDLAVTTAKLDDEAVTPDKLASAVSGSSDFSALTTTSTTPAAVSGGSVTVTASGGRYMLVNIKPRGNSVDGYLYCVSTTAATNGRLRVDAGAATYYYTLNNVLGNKSAPLSFTILTPAAAGTFTVAMYLFVDAAAGSPSIQITAGTIEVVEI